MASHRALLPILVSIFLALPTLASLGPEEGNPSRRPLPAHRLEVPDDPFVPVPREAQKTGSAYRYETERFFTT